MIDFCRAEQTRTLLIPFTIIASVAVFGPDGIREHDAGSTLPLLSFALLGVAVLRRKLRC